MLQQGILRRDLSEFNILLYSQWDDTGMDANIIEGVPPLIHDLLPDVLW